jgi:hypothetical protein
MSFSSSLYLKEGNEWSLPRNTGRQGSTCLLCQNGVLILASDVLLTDVAVKWVVTGAPVALGTSISTAPH